MTQASEIESFTQRMFGDDAQGVAFDMVEAGRVAHTDAQAAQDGSRLDTHQPYGSTYWLALHNEVVSRLCQRLEGAVAFTPRGAQYDLVLWNELIILPVKVLDSWARNGVLRIRTSQLRANLASVNVPAPPTLSLFDDEESQRDLADQALEVAKLAQAAFDNVATKVLIAAYACSVRGGLKIVEVGIGTLDQHGEIDFSDSERLSVAAQPTAGTGLVEVAGDSWSRTPKPKPVLEAVDVEKVAIGADESDVTPNAPTTE